MRELKLRYIIDLVSNVAANAKKDEDALVKAQAAMQKELSGTDVKLGMVTRGLMRMNGVSHAGIERQAQYLTTLANNALKATQRLENLGKSIATVHKVGMALGAGTWAAGRVLQGPAMDAMAYDRRLAGMANTAFTDRDIAGRIEGMKTLEAAVKAARKFGGGTRDQAAEALDTMIASGTVEVVDAIKMLPAIVKGATASGATTNELATIGIRAMQSFKVKAEELPKIISGAMVAGQVGGFELVNMAKWLPQQMAMGGTIGMSGKQGIAKLAAYNQASVITAGTKDEAGNNLKDLLNEVNTGHFTAHMAQVYLNKGQYLKKGDRLNKIKSMDDVFLDYQARGVNKVDATIDLMRKTIEADPKYQKLKGRLKEVEAQEKATPERQVGARDELRNQRREILEAMQKQVEGTNVGKVFRNQQSLSALLAIMNNEEYVKKVFDKVMAEMDKKESASEVSKSKDVVSSTAGFKWEQANQDALDAKKATMDNLTPSIGKAAELFSDLVDKNASLVGSTMLATTALGAFAATAGMASMMMGGGLLGKLGGRAASLLGRGAAVVAGAGQLGGLATAGAAGYAAGSAMGWGIDKLIQNATGQKDATLGTLLYDKFNPSPIQAPRADLAARVRANAGNMRPIDPVSFITLTAPKQGPQQMATGRNTEVKVGEGRIAVDVRITDQRTQTSATVVQQPNLVKLNAGATNPGSTGSW